MKKLKCTIETFSKVREEPEPWKTSEWGEDEETKFEPRLVKGVLDAGDIQYYMGVRDDRVAVIFKNGAVVSVVVEFEVFDTAVTDALL